MNKATNNMLRQGLLAMLVMLVSAGSALAQQSLFFSEYIEGSSNNKALEIYNPTSETLDLSDYMVLRSNNGNATWQDTLRMEGMLASGEVYIIANPSADQTDRKSVV